MPLATAVTVLSSPADLVQIKMAICLRILCPRGERAAATRPTYSSGRAAAVAANIDQLIQEYTAEYTGRDRQRQADTSRYEFHIKSYVTVCHAEIQADTDKVELLYQIIWACMHFHICFHIHADTIKYKQI